LISKKICRKPSTAFDDNDRARKRRILRDCRRKRGHAAQNQLFQTSYTGRRRFCRFCRSADIAVLRPDDSAVCRTSLVALARKG
jgi:hypothetical protein